MKEIVYNVFVWLIASCFFVTYVYFSILFINDFKHDKEKKINESSISADYEINGTIYSCRKELQFNKEKLICERKNNDIN